MKAWSGRPGQGTLGLLGAILLALIGCEVGPQPRSEMSFGQLARAVESANAADVAALLGEPDSRRAVLPRTERWIWWNYTFLDGPDVPPEQRGAVVHLALTFRRAVGPFGEVLPRSEWFLVEPYGVEYLSRDAAEGMP